ncbi:MAG: zinc ribbon domain-containing protein [Chloroflexota bacterium]
MPIYEYGCEDCQQQINVFFRSFAEVETRQVVCPHCHSTHLKRLISGVTIIQPEGQRSQKLSNFSHRDDQEDNSPRAFASKMRKMNKDIGGDLGDDFNHVVSRLEAGESPESIDKDYPVAG